MHDIQGKLEKKKLYVFWNIKNLTDKYNELLEHDKEISAALIISILNQSFSLLGSLVSKLRKNLHFLKDNLWSSHS